MLYTHTHTHTHTHMENCMSLPPPPPPPPRPSNRINDLIQEGKLSTSLVLETLGSALLVVLLLWLVGQAFFKRLWLLPSPPRRILALNAATLSLLSIVAKPGAPGNTGFDADESAILAFTGLICAMLGALMPSVAASTNLRDMWSNVVGVGLLVISVNFVTFLQLFYLPDGYFDTAPTIHGGLVRKQVVIMASMFLLLLVLLVQAVALPAMMSDTKTIISERLQNLHMEAKPGYKADVIIKNKLWSWELVERNTHIKLMMVLTSNPQNLMTRSPSAAIVGTIVVVCLVMSGTDNLFLILFQGPATVVCGFICIWRWMRVALHEDRPLSTLAFNAEPSYWRRDVNNYLGTLKAGPRSSQPNALEEGQWGFQEVLYYTAAFLVLCFVVPFHKLLVALIRFSQIFSALLVQTIIRLPIKTLGPGIVILCRKLIHKSGGVNIDAAAADHSSTSLNSLGVVCLEGEDARIVGQQFAGAANRIIQRQVKRAKKKSDMKALMSHLQSFRSSEIIAAGKSTAILVTLNKDGTPDVQNLHVEHGYQFGWSLTVISLLALLANIEVTALGRSTMSEAAVIACWQAMEMMQLVDEQFVPCIVCTKETYASACASAWSKLQKKKRRPKERQEIKVDAINQILEATLASTKKEFNKAKSSAPDGMPAAWSQQAVMSYTLHTICRNLLRWWSDVEAAATAAINGRGGEERDARKMIEGMVEYINVLIGEVVACCISNLPLALDMSTADAVLRGSMSDIEKSLVLAAQGKHLWEGLQWPPLHSLRNTRLGQLSQWMH